MTGTPHFRQRDASEQAWRQQGLCWGANVDLWYPTRDESEGHQAETVCHGCPVRTECLEYALDNNEDIGIWGGTSARQRRRIRQARRRAGRAA